MDSNPHSNMRYPGVAVGVIVLHEGRVLLGKRKGELGTGLYSLPGGKVDFGESPIDAAKRELKEETGLVVSCLKFIGKVSNDYFPEHGKHYINLFYLAVAKNPQDVHVPDSEKDKFDTWEWFTPMHLPENTWEYTGKVILHVWNNMSLRPLLISGVDCED